MSVGEELDSVDVRLVASKRLDGLAGSNIPQLGESVAGTRDEGVLVRRVERNAHDVPKMIGELGNLLTSFDVPFHTGHVARGSQDAAVVDKSAARQIASMTGQLSSDTCGAVALLIEVVDGANVVEATAGHKVSAGGIGAGHDP